VDFGGSLSSGQGSGRARRSVVAPWNGKSTSFTRAAESSKRICALAPEVTFFMTELSRSGPLENLSLWSCWLAGSGEWLGVELVEFFEPARGVGD
jgi:hypothetical protein